MSKRKTSLKKKIVVNMVIFAVLLLFLLGTLVCVRYYHSRKAALTEQAFEFTRTAAELIDGDKLPGYLETWERDDHYHNILAYLNAVQDQTSVKYFYVVIPHEEDIVYVWDAGPPDDAYSLGYREKYQNSEDRSMMLAAMQKDPPEEISVESDDLYGFIGSAYSPVFNSKGEAVALACVDMPLTGLVVAMLSYLVILILFMTGTTILATRLLYGTIKRDVIGPINVLKKSANEMVGNIENDETAEININTGDEIEDLANAFTKMDSDLREYIRDLSAITAEKEHIIAELNVAANIQKSMLPLIFPAFPELKEFDLYALMHPAREVGGDFYDFFMVDDHHIGLVIADVSGKGIPAALFMMASKIILKNNLQGGKNPAEVLRRTNEQLLENNETDMFVTVWIAVIDIRTGRGVASNAGHEHPALRKKDGLYEMVKYRHSPAVGMLEGIRYEEHGFELAPGDTLFVYTDGVTEATNRDEKLFGEERVLNALNTQPDAEPEDILRIVRKSIDEFAGDAPQFDDITMMAFRYNG